MISAVLQQFLFSLVHAMWTQWQRRCVRLRSLSLQVWRGLLRPHHSPGRLRAGKKGTKKKKRFLISFLFSMTIIDELRGSEIKKTGCSVLFLNLSKLLRKLVHENSHLNILQRENVSRRPRSKSHGPWEWHLRVLPHRASPALLPPFHTHWTTPDDGRHARPPFQLRSWTWKRPRQSFWTETACEYSPDLLFRKQKKKLKKKQRKPNQVPSGFFQWGILAISAARSVSSNVFLLFFTAPSIILPFFMHLRRSLLQGTNKTSQST